MFILHYLYHKPIYLCASFYDTIGIALKVIKNNIINVMFLEIFNLTYYTTNRKINCLWLYKYIITS